MFRYFFLNFIDVPYQPVLHSNFTGGCSFIKVTWSPRALTSKEGIGDGIPGGDIYCHRLGLDKQHCIKQFKNNFLFIYTAGAEQQIPYKSEGKE